MKKIISLLVGMALITTLGTGSFSASAAVNYTAALGLHSNQSVLQTLNADINRDGKNDTVVLYETNPEDVFYSIDFGVGVIYADGSVKKYEFTDRNWYVQDFTTLDLGGTSLYVCVVTDIHAGDHEHNSIQIIDFSGKQPRGIWDDSVASAEALGLQFAYADNYKLNFSFLSQAYARDFLKNDDYELSLYNTDGTLNSYGDALRNWEYPDEAYDYIINTDKLNNIALVSIKQDYFTNNPFGPMADHPLGVDTTWRYNPGSGQWALAKTTVASDITGSNGIALTVNGANVILGRQAINYHDRVLVPLTDIAYALGVNAIYDASTGTITASRGNTSIVMNLGKLDMTQNGRTISVPVAPLLETVNHNSAIDSPPDDTVFVPVRAVAEAFGATVNWDGNTSTVNITDSAYKILLPAEKTDPYGNLVAWDNNISNYPLYATIQSDDIYLYGLDSYGMVLYQNGKGTYFDWPGLTPREVLPQMEYSDFDHDGKKELAVLLYVGSGTGFAAMDLHILTVENVNSGRPTYTDYTLLSSNVNEWMQEKITAKLPDDKKSFIVDTCGGKYTVNTLGWDEEAQKNYTFTGVTFGNIVFFNFDGTDIQTKINIGAVYKEAPHDPLYFGYIEANVVFDGKNFKLQDYTFTLDQ